MSKILVVDDESDVRNTLSGLLQDAGYAVKAVGSDGEALTAITQESFDFALIDVRLHGDSEDDESGLSLAMNFTYLAPQVRVILLTRYVRTRQIVRAIRYYGVVDFIEKTQDLGNQVLNTIAKALTETRRRYFEKIGNSTQLSLSLLTNQPLFVRTFGNYIYSARTSKVLSLPVERYARRVEAARKDPDNWRLQVQEIGRNLWREIFGEHPEVSGAYHESRANNLTILVEGPREFLQLPLEFLFSEQHSDYIILEHPLVRFVHGAISKRKALSPHMFALMKKLRVLIIASNTHDDASPEVLPFIGGVDRETRELADYLRSQLYFPVEVTLIPTERAIYNRVKAEINKPDYDIIHYAGHGSFNVASPEESCLYFWAGDNKQGPIVAMKATELKMLLRQSGARMVYLSSCEGAASGSSKDLLDDDFLGLTDAIVQAGVPTVLGYRWPVSDVGAPKLAKAFYQSLLDQGSPEVALWSARSELAGLDRNDTTWLSPILVHQV
jgi:CheY-like chemotaxis protein